MSRSFNINFTWPFMIGVSMLITAGTFLVRAIIGSFMGNLTLKGSFFSIVMSLVVGGIGWLFVKVAQANQEAEEEAES